MKKTIIILILIIIASTAYSLTMKKETAVIPQADETATTTDSGTDTSGTNDKYVRGTVISVDTSKVPVDGPALVTIQAEGGSRAVIAIPSMGINFCPALANITSVQELKSGETVEVRGEVGAEGVILPCQSSAHYLRVVR